MKKKRVLIFFSLVVLVGCLFVYQQATRLSGYGLMDSTGKWVVKPSFAELADFHEGLAAVKINDKWGFINVNGKLVIPTKFSEVTPFSNGIAEVSWQGKSRFIDKTGKEIIPIQYDDIRHLKTNTNFFRILIKNKWGLVNKQGQILIPPKYDQVKAFYDHFVIVLNKNKWGILNTNGEVILPMQYNYIERILEHPAYQPSKWFKAKKGNQLFIVDSIGSIIPSEFESIRSHINGRFIVKNKGEFTLANILSKKTASFHFDEIVDIRNPGPIPEEALMIKKKSHWTLIDFQGNHRLQTLPDTIVRLNNHLYVSHLQKKRGLIYKNGKEIITPQFDSIYTVREGFILADKGDKVALFGPKGQKILASVHDEIEIERENNLFFIKNDQTNKWAIFKQNGEQLFPFQFDDYLNFLSSPIKIQQGKKWGIMNTSGQMMVSPKYDYIKYFREGLAVFIQKGKYGAVDTNGKVIVTPQFDYLTDFSAGLAAMQLGGKWGFIDTSGKVFIPAQYETTAVASTHLLAFQEKGKMGFMNRQKKILCPPQFDFFLTYYVFQNNQFNYIILIRKNGKWGIMNQAGKILILPKYDEIKPDLRYFKFQKNGKWGIVNIDNQEIIPAKYTKISQKRAGYKIQQKQKVGFIDSTGKIILPPKYDKINLRGPLIIASQNKKQLLFTQKGQKLPLSFSKEIKLSKVKGHPDLIMFSQQHKWGLLDSTGKILMKAQYSGLSRFVIGKQEYLKIYLKNKVGLADLKGNILLPPKYDKISRVSNHLLSLKRDDKYWLVDQALEKVLRTGFLELEKLSNGLIKVYRK